MAMGQGFKAGIQQMAGVVTGGMFSMLMGAANAPVAAARALGEQLVTSQQVRWGLALIAEFFKHSVGPRRLTASDAGAIAADVRRIFASLQGAAEVKEAWLRRGGARIWLPGARGRVDLIRLALQLEGLAEVGEGRYQECQEIAWKIQSKRDPLAAGSQNGQAKSTRSVPETLPEWPHFEDIPWDSVRGASDQTVQDVVDGAIWVMRAIRGIARDNLDLLRRNSTTAYQEPLTEPGALEDAARQATELAAFTILAGRGLRALLQVATAGTPDEAKGQLIADETRTSVSGPDTPSHLSG